MNRHHTCWNQALWCSSAKAQNVGSSVLWPQRCQGSAVSNFKALSDKNSFTSSFWDHMLKPAQVVFLVCWRAQTASPLWQIISSVSALPVSTQAKYQAKVSQPFVRVTVDSYVLVWTLIICLSYQFPICSSSDDCYTHTQTEFSPTTEVFWRLLLTSERRCLVLVPRGGFLFPSS